MPFFLCPIIDSNNPEESILHLNAIRIRVVGSGNLIPTFQSLDNAFSQTLVSIPMNSGNGIQFTRLANFQAQRGFLKIETDLIDETFDINRIIVFSKILWTSYPSLV